MDEGLILLEFKKTTVCSLAIMVRSSQQQLVQALGDLQAMLENKMERPEGLKEDQQIIDHLNLHNLMIADSEIIMGEIQQGLEELEAEEKAAANTPFWEKIKP